MRVLWFSHTLRYSEYGTMADFSLPGWVSGLIEAWKKNRPSELGVAILVPHSKIKKFTVDGITYFPLSNGYSTKLRKWWHKISHSIDIPGSDRQFAFINQAFRPDVVQVFGAEFGFAGFSKHTSAPLLIHLLSVANGYLGHWYDGGYSAMQVLKHTDLKSLVTGAGVFHARLRFKKQAKREAVFLSEARYVTGRTNWDRTLSQKLAPRARYFHCEEIIRNSFFTKEWAPHGGPLTIVTIINPNLYKGLELIHAAANIIGSDTQIPITWHVAGFEPSSEIVRLANAKCRVVSTSVRINYRGHLNEQEIIQLLQNATLYVHPSHIENSSNSICEAMALGMPVVATASGGTPSIITDNLNGILVPPNNAKQLAAAIVILLEHPEKSHEMGKMAKQTAQMRHHPGKILESLQEIYRQMTG